MIFFCLLLFFFFHHASHTGEFCHYIDVGKNYKMRNIFSQSYMVPMAAAYTCEDKTVRYFKVHSVEIRQSFLLLFLNCDQEKKSVALLIGP